MIMDGDTYDQRMSSSSVSCGCSLPEMLTDGDELQLQYPPSEYSPVPTATSSSLAYPSTFRSKQQTLAPRPDLKLITSTCHPSMPDASYFPTSMTPPSSAASPSSILSPLSGWTTPTSAGTDAATIPIYPTSNSFSLPLYPSAQATSSTKLASYDLCAQAQGPNHFQAGSQANDDQDPQPDPSYRFPPDASETPLPQWVTPTRAPSSSRDSPPPSSRVKISHPYARLYARNSTSGESKRRKMWNHVLEKSVFSAQELSSMRAPDRRKIYTASLEAHVDRLHAQLLEYKLYPVPFKKLDPYHGLNSKTAKSMVAGLQKDATDMGVKILELERSNHALEGCLMAHAVSSRAMLQATQGGIHSSSTVGGSRPQNCTDGTAPRRHSIGSTSDTCSYPNYFVQKTV